VDQRAGPGGRPSLLILVLRQGGRVLRTLREVENLFTFMIMGELVGVPVLPPYYAVRLVPYLVNTVPAWRRRVLRERQPFEHEEFDLHGV
jgi:hypothetical protein